MDVKPGDVFKVSYDIWGNDQAYHIAIPCLLKDGSFGMIDTYQISYQGGCREKEKYKCARDKIIKCATDPKIGDWTYYSSCENFYYKNHCKLNDNESKFTYWFNVNDYEYATNDDSYKYKDDDVLHGVKLYFEHGYSWHYGSVGIDLKKKNALIVPYLEFHVRVKNIADMSSNPYASTLFLNNIFSIGRDIIDSEYISNTECVKQLRNDYVSLLRVEKLDELEKILKTFQKSTSEFVRNLLVNLSEIYLMKSL